MSFVILQNAYQQKNAKNDPQNTEKYVELKDIAMPSNTLSYHLRLIELYLENELTDFMGGNNNHPQESGVVIN